MKGHGAGGRVEPLLLFFLLVALYPISTILLLSCFDLIAPIEKFAQNEQ
jgi:hypothetical protein